MSSLRTSRPLRWASRVAVPTLLLAFASSACGVSVRGGGSSASADTEATPIVLVPTSQGLLDVCADELATTYCNENSAQAAIDECLTKASPEARIACDPIKGCLAEYTPHREGKACMTGKTYPTPSTCQEPAVDDCSFYRTCLEGAAPCAESGTDYALQFGEPLCYAFIEKRDTFTSDGQAWLRGVRTCLQRALVPLLDEQNTCEQILEDAYASHVGCYTQTANSICTLPIHDAVALMRIISYRLLDPRVLVQVHQTAKICAEQLLLPGALPDGNLALHRAFFSNLDQAAKDADTLRDYLDAQGQ